MHFSAGQRAGRKRGGGQHGEGQEAARRARLEPMWLTPPSLTLWDVESGAQWPCTIRKHTTAAGHEHVSVGVRELCVVQLSVVRVLPCARASLVGTPMHLAVCTLPPKCSSRSHCSPLPFPNRPNRAPTLLPPLLAE